jgi:transposase
MVRIFDVAKTLYQKRYIKYMKLTQKAIDDLKSNKRARARLQLDFDKSEYTINRWINENEDNGFLTTAQALKIIQEETELTSEQILEVATV